MLSAAKHPQVDSCARTGNVNPCAIRLIRVFRVLWLYGFLATLGMTEKGARNFRACDIMTKDKYERYIQTYAHSFVKMTQAKLTR